MSTTITVLKSTQVKIELPAYFTNPQKTAVYKVMDKDHYFEICRWGNAALFKRSDKVSMITADEICSQMEQIEKPDFYQVVQEAVKRKDAILDDLMADEDLPTIDMALNNIFNNNNNNNNEINSL